MSFAFRTAAFLLSSSGALALSAALVAAPANAQQNALKVAATAFEIDKIQQTYDAPFDGVYVLRVPAIAGVSVSVDGAVLLTVPDTVDGQTLSVITTLKSGPRDVVVAGLDPARGHISIAPNGEPGVPLLRAAAAIAAPAPTPTAPAPVAVTPSVPAAIKAAPAPASAGAPMTSVAAAATTTKGGSTPPPTAVRPGTFTAFQSDTRPANTSSSERSGGGLAGGLEELGEVGVARTATGEASGGRSGGLAGGIGGLPGMGDTDPVMGAPLAPPVGAIVDSGIQLTYAGDAEGRVPNTGATLFGAVGSDVFYDQIEVTVQPSGRTAIVDVAPESGQFAVRLFREDLDRTTVTVALSGMVSSDPDMRSAPVSVSITPSPLDASAMQAMSRLTFGPSPELHARLRTMSFEDFVNEQLRPDQIDDSAFQAAYGNIIASAQQNDSDIRRSWEHYELAVATYSERQLQEVMGRFWFNHFHARNKDTSVQYQAVIDRDFFRANAFGNFEDILLHSARSPLMSQYLDNDQSRAGFINENYGREILELHTLGVDAGYTLDDIIAVSRVFTGWNWERTQDRDGNSRDRHQFLFRADRHDSDDKYIPFLDVTIAGRDGADGVLEGEELIAMLANHPATRKNVCTKMVQLLAADVPPATLVGACESAWADTDGEIEPMLRAILFHPDYLGNADLRRSKVKTPFEYTVSAIRAFGIEPSRANRTTFLNEMRLSHTEAGESQRNFAAPTGLPEVGAAWTNSASFIALYRRMMNILRDPERFGHDPIAPILDAGLESAEEVATYLMLGSSDHYTPEELDAVVAELKGTDGIFDPYNRDERNAIRRGMIAAIIQSSFHIQ